MMAKSGKILTLLLVALLFAAAPASAQKDKKKKTEKKELKDNSTESKPKEDYDVDPKKKRTLEGDSESDTPFANDDGRASEGPKPKAEKLVGEDASDEEIEMASMRAQGKMVSREGAVDSLGMMGILEPDTIPIQQEETDSAALRNRIHLLIRSYGDRVVLRWAPSDYASWYFLNRYGYLLLRNDIDDLSMRVDTIESCLKPATIEAFRQKYDPNDSIAGIAVETIYGSPQTTNPARSAPGTLGSVIEASDEQNAYYSMGMMAAEMNIGVAHDMALAYTDKNVVQGKRYAYRVQSLVPTDIIDIEPGGLFTNNVPYEPQPYDVELIDSVTPPNQVTLTWERGQYFAHDIERRSLSDTTATARAGEWERLNDHPYIYMSTDQQQAITEGELYIDHVEHYGVYEYRIKGYDTFGDKTLPSKSVRVKVGDMTPPRAPSIDLFEILRPDDKIFAKIKWHKDTVEADFTGFRVLYYNKNVYDDWMQLGEDLPASATETTVDVTELPTGLVCVAALDSAGNLGPSVPQSMRIMDLVPPSVPENLRANVAPDGLIMLRWSACPEKDVDYYELQYANELAEGFTTLGTVHQDTVFADSVSITVSQRYIYYRIRALDYATNPSDYSEPIEVLRPHFQPPLVCRLDTAWVSGDRVNMKWVQSGEADLAYHRLFRRLENSDTWELLAVYDADSVRYYGNDFITIVDEPKPNLRDDYIYALDTWNLSHFCSGLSKMHSFSVVGERLVDVGIKLKGSYERQGGETHIAWETSAIPDYGPYYFCVYRRGPDDDDFQFVNSVDGEPQWSDVLTRPGQTAEYYVKLRFEDGRESRRSNVVKVSAPKQE